MPCRLVSSVVSSNFLHEQGLPSSNFQRFVGIPKIAYFGDEEADRLYLREQPDRDTAVIYVPMIHPGWDKYEYQHPEFRRVMDLRFMAHTKLLSIVFRLTTDKEHIRERADLLDEVLKRYEAAISPRFSKELEKAKDDLSVIWNRKNSTHISLIEKQGDLQTVNAELRAWRGDSVIGSPGSDDRKEQVTWLWDFNWPGY